MTNLEILEEELRQQEAVFTDAASKELAAHIENINTHLDRQNENRNRLSAYIETSTDVLEMMELTIAYQKTIEAIAELEDAKKQCIECLIKISANHIAFTCL